MEWDRRGAALLAIDLQRAFCAQDGVIGRQGRDMGPCAAAAARALELVATARAGGVPVIWTRFALRDDYADGGLLTSTLRPNLRAIGALAASHPDTALIADPGPGEIVIDKTRYSAFHGTGLEERLAERGIGRLMLCGVTTSMCVESTARDAGQHDIATLVVAEACGDFDPARHAASLAAIDFGFARVVGMADALARLSR